MGDGSVPTTAGGGEERKGKGSPEQIAGWLRDHTDDGVSGHTRRSIAASCSGRGGAEEELLGYAIEAHDPSITAGGPRLKRGQKGSRLDPPRPAAVEEGGYGHGEGISDRVETNSYIATWSNVIRVTAMLAKVANKVPDGHLCAHQAGQKLPELYKSLTGTGQGRTDHRRFTWATNIDVYWIRKARAAGSNRAPRPLRQYFPRNRPSAHSQSTSQQEGRVSSTNGPETCNLKPPEIKRRCVDVSRQTNSGQAGLLALAG